MTDQPVPGVSISTRPFLSDMFAQTGQEAPANTAAAGGRENAHLFAAVTANRPHLHRVEDDERPSAIPAAATPEHLADNYQLPTYRRRGNQAETVPGMLDQVDWKIVADLASQLTLPTETNSRTLADFDVAIASAGPETPYEQAALTEIENVVTRKAEWMVVQGGLDTGWTEQVRAQYVQAIFDQAFRYGRIQQFLREEDVEDISVTGHDNVVVTKTNGRKERRPAIADSDEDLSRMLADYAQKRGRSFANPGGRIHLDIGGARLWAAAAPKASKINLTIRKHNLVDVDFDDLIGYGTLTPEVARALDQCIKAGASALVAGYAGAGKTTFLRAWMSRIPVHEKIVTIETERELYLDKQPHRHWQVAALQFQPAEFSARDSVDSYSLDEAFFDSLRASSTRLLVGEMRGPESRVVIKAMRAGQGSISTIHSRGADDAIHRFADMLMDEQKLNSDIVPLRGILRSIDIIVYLDYVEYADGTRSRVVSEIAECRANDQGLPMASALFRYDFSTGAYTRPEKPSEDLKNMLRRRNPVGTRMFWEEGA